MDEANRSALRNEIARKLGVCHRCHKAPARAERVHCEACARKVAVASKARDLRDPERKRFQHAIRERVARAVRSGRLTPGPWERCGAARTEAHHDDYGKPLDVRWLCRSCH